MAAIRAEGVSLGVVRQRAQPRLPGTARANKGQNAKEKAPFTVELAAITG